MLKIAVLFGGRGAERAVSCRSCATVLSHISDRYYHVVPIGIDAVGNFWLYGGEISRIADGSWETDENREWTFPVRQDGRGVFRTRNEDITVDAVLPILHGDDGEDGKIQGLLDTVGIPYAGAGVLGGALCFDKAATKRIAESLHIPVVPWISVVSSMPTETVKRKVRQKFGARPFPLFVKPSSLGSSIGTAKVCSFRGLFEAIALAAPYGEVLIEKYVGHKREIEIAYLDGDLPLFSEAGEIRVGKGYYDYREKYEKHDAKIGKASLDTETQERLYRYAKTLLAPLHIRDLCRFDFFLTGDGIVYFNEVNTMPGLTDISLYPRLMTDAGISPEALIERWVALALDRRI